MNKTVWRRAEGIRAKLEQKQDQDGYLNLIKTPSGRVLALFDRQAEAIDLAMHQGGERVARLSDRITLSQIYSTLLGVEQEAVAS